MSSLDIPEDAKCSEDIDCVLLTSWPSYRSHIVRLTAEEKGLNWRHYYVDIHSKLA